MDNFESLSSYFRLFYYNSRSLLNCFLALYPRHIFWIVITDKRILLNYFIYFLVKYPRNTFWISVAAWLLLIKLFYGDRA